MQSNALLWKDNYMNNLPEKLFPVSIQYGIIHIHIPKTAGTSIRTALFGSDVIKHVTASKIPIDIWESIPSFAVVRHPVSRFISSYKYHCKSSYRGVLLKRYPELKSMSMKEYAETFLKEDYLLLEPQMKYVQRSDSNKSIVDYLLRFEYISDDFSSLCKKLNIKLNLDKLKASDNIDVEIDSETLSIVEKFYECDYDLYNESLTSLLE